MEGNEYLVEINQIRMAISIDSYLRTLSYEKYYLRRNSEEITRIDNSIKALFTNLSTEFKYKIRSKNIFGSYDRDTILPRSIDPMSDVDIMVIFNHTDFERTPETYRNWLKEFAEKYYKNKYGSSVEKTFPTITLKLENISYDLVPAKQVDTFWSSKIYIPDEGNDWVETDPKDVKDKLTDANTRYNSIVKPIIRIFKAWNAKASYPIDSYELENLIAGMNFSNDNIQSGFLYAAKKLNSDYSFSQKTDEKISSLVYNLEKASDCLLINDLEAAKRWLHRVLPL